MTSAAALLSVGASFIAAKGALQQGRAEDEAAQFQANALEAQAASERDAAGAEAEDFSRQQSRTRASSLARLGASGVSSAGSPLLVDEAFIREGALGEMRILQSGSVRSTRLKDQAGLERTRGKFARRAASLSATGSLLTGFSGALSSGGFFGSKRPSGSGFGAGG